MAAPVSSTKPLSKSLNYLMRKLFFRQIDNCNKQSIFFSGINSLWTIFNNKPVINSINNLNKHCKALSTSCFEVSTSDTKIPHNKLIKVLINCFKGINKK